MLRHIFMAVFEMDPLVRRRLGLGAHARPPLLCRADRSRRKSAAAVWADVLQFVFDTIRAERTLVAANARVGRGWRQVFVAVLAVRPKLQRYPRGRLRCSQIDRGI